MTQIPEWERFKVGKPSTTANWINPDCRPLTQVAHIAHTHVALEIARQGRVKAGLVQDKSKLNTKRVSVVWTSPNQWSAGFRYGNILFSFDWEKLVQGKNYYWVESVAYNTAACRILVTAQDRGNELNVYDPCAANGPWWFDQKQNRHYWNGNYCLEIMLEADLLLADADKVDFVKHHPQGCNINHSTCPDKGLSAYTAGARFIAGAAGEDLQGHDVKLADTRGDVSAPSDALSFAWDIIDRSIKASAFTYTGGVEHGAKEAATFARSFLRAYGRSNSDEQKIFAQLFRSQDDLRRSCAHTIKSTFKIDDACSLDQDDAGF